MNIGISGVSGFIGSRIAELAAQRGHTVIGFSRSAPRPIPHCKETRLFSLDQKINLEGCDAIIHLAGENVFRLWTQKKKQRILESRQAGTRHLINTINASTTPPKVLVSGSAIGFYGDTGEQETDEDSPGGHGFLAEVTQVWEAEALRASERGVRTVLLRTAVVLGRNGGALGAMLPVFRLGAGGRLGSGRQWMSWIHLDDIAAMALFGVETAEVQGPLNASSPAPVRNTDFTHALAGALHRPAFMHVPAFALRTVLGQFSEELLGSKRVIPKKAIAAGFNFKFPNLSAALADILKV